MGNCTLVYVPLCAIQSHWLQTRGNDSCGNVRLFSDMHTNFMLKYRNVNIHEEREACQGKVSVYWVNEDWTRDWAQSTKKCWKPTGLLFYERTHLFIYSLYHRYTIYRVYMCVNIQYIPLYNVPVIYVIPFISLVTVCEYSNHILLSLMAYLFSWWCNIGSGLVLCT